jgi:apolipoprotein N-acyltransferase
VAFASKGHGLVFALLATAITAVLVYFGTGLFPRWPLMWLAPIPVLLFASRSSWWAAALVAFCAWLLGGLNLLHYFNSPLHLPPAVQAIIFTVPSLLFAISVLLFRWLVRRESWWSAALGFPAAWVSFEYVANLMSPHGTSGNLSYSQLNFLPFLQLASLTGPWGMSFLLMLFAAALVASIEARGSSPRQAWRILGASWGVIVLVLIFGGVRLSSSQAGNADVAAPGPDADRLLHAYGTEVEALASRGAQVIVLPEKLAVVLAPDSGKTDSFFQSLADKTEAKLIVGMVYVEGATKYNRSRVYTPHAPVESYDKHHMLPPFESNLKPGTSILTMSKPSGTWGVAICKDMDFTPLSRQYGNAGVGLMLVPAWDFVLDRASHGHIAVMRGVEDGFSIARAAKQGFLTVSDDRGRILAETRSNSAPLATLVADVPAGHEKTIYSRLGDWFACVALVTLALTLAQLFRKPVRAN